VSGRVFELSLNKRSAARPPQPALTTFPGSLAPTALDLPAVRPQDEPAPIFTLLESEWFRGRRAARSGSVTDSAVRARVWTSPADAGWRRAAEVAAQPPPAVTDSGLPRRVPGRNLVPGNAGTAGRPPAPADPRRARGLGGFQQGVGRARHAADPDRDDQA
jgi:hypothetical protein